MTSAASEPFSSSSASFQDQWSPQIGRCYCLLTILMLSMVAMRVIDTLVYLPEQAVSDRGTQYASVSFAMVAILLMQSPRLLSPMSIRRNVSAVRTLVSSQLVYENAKTVLFFYVLLTRSQKAYRHLRARGITYSIKELWRYISQVR